MPGPIGFRGVRIGVPICEDIWGEEVCECLQETGSEMLISPNGSPFDWPKPDQRMNVAVARVTETGLPLIYVNQIGGQDELVFDGASFVLNADLSLAVQMPAWEEAMTLVEMRRTAGGWACAQGERAAIEEQDAAAYHACMLGLRDYVNKNGFPGVVLGLSGGVDSALVAAMATDALGPERVHCVMLPYRYTSNESLSDAAACAEALGVRYETIPIAEPVEGFLKVLAKPFAGAKPDITEENIQSRVRGSLLMAISNKFGSMVLTTGNKSEMSVGYATLYGDMNGGFNPIKDLYKMEVYALCRWRNAHVPKGAKGPRRRGDPGEHSHQGADRGAAREPEGPGQPAGVRGAGRHPQVPGRGRDAARRHRRARACAGGGEEGRAAALPRRVQAAAGGARRENLGAQFRSRPALSDHQQVPRGHRRPLTPSAPARPVRARIGTRDAINLQLQIAILS